MDTTATHSPQCVAVGADVVARSVGEELILLDLHSGNYFTLNGMGALIWTQLAEGLQPTAIAAHIVDAYDADVAQVEEDVLVLVRDLADRGLVVAS